MNEIDSLLCVCCDNEVDREDVFWCAVCGNPMCDRCHASNCGVCGEFGCE